MVAHRSMEITVHQPIAPRAEHAIGRLKVMPPTVVVLHRGPGVDRRIGRRMAQTRWLALPTRIAHRGRVPVRALIRAARPWARRHGASTMIGRPAATARTSRHRARAPRTTTTTARRTRMAAVAPMSRPPARTPHPAAATRPRRVRILRLRVRTRRRAAVTLHRARVTPHPPARTPLRAALTQRLAVVMAVVAEARTIVEEAVTAAVVAEARAAAEAAALEAVGEARAETVHTDIKFQGYSPPQNWGGFFLCCGISERISPHNSSAAKVFSRVREVGRAFPDWT